ncbi:MAG: hypothetical protein V9G12_04015 [Microthrixaceae bacterium]
MMGLVGAMGTAAIYWWGGRQVIDGVIALGSQRSRRWSSASTTIS